MTAEQLANLQEIAENAHIRPTRRIVAKSGDEYLLLNAEEVFAFEAEADLVWIITAKKRYLATQTLKVASGKAAQYQFPPHSPQRSGQHRSHTQDEHVDQPALAGYAQQQSGVYCQQATGKHSPGASHLLSPTHARCPLSSTSAAGCSLSLMVPKSFERNGVTAVQICHATYVGPVRSLPGSVRSPAECGHSRINSRKPRPSRQHNLMYAQTHVRHSPGFSVSRHPGSSAFCAPAPGSCSVARQRRHHRRNRDRPIRRRGCQSSGDPSQCRHAATASRRNPARTVRFG